MKYLITASIIALALTFGLLSCITPQPAPLEDCQESLNKHLSEYMSRGRKMLGGAQFAPGVIGRFFEGPNDERYILVFVSPGALTPPPGSPYKLLGVCATPSGDGRIYEAHLQAEPSL